MLENEDYSLQIWTDDYVFERMELPRSWATLNNGFEIQELKPNRIDEIIQIIQVTNINFN